MIRAKGETLPRPWAEVAKLVNKKTGRHLSEHDARTHGCSAMKKIRAAYMRWLDEQTVGRKGAA